MRSKNQNVLDAEARQRDEDARLAALDARLAAEGAPPAEAAPNALRDCTSVKDVFDGIC